MDLQLLAAELAKPAYSEMNDQEAADALNALTVARPIQRFVSIRTMYADIGPETTETIVAKLTAAAATNPVIARVLSWMAPAEGGIDMGNSVTRAQVVGLCTAGLFTTAERDALLGMGEEIISIADSIGVGGIPLAHDVEHARELI